MVNDDAREFPDESEWLGLPCPPVGPGFVERTLLRITAEREQQDATLRGLLPAFEVPPPSADFVARALGRAAPTSLESASQALEFAPVLAAFEAPLPSADFVDRTLARLRAGSGALEGALVAPATDLPEPSPDFVDRVLRALREERQSEPPVLRLRAAAPWLAVAAVLVVSLGLLPRILGTEHRPAPAPIEVVAAPTFAADHWAAALAAMQDDGLGVVADDPLLALAAAARRRATD